MYVCMYYEPLVSNFPRCNFLFRRAAGEIPSGALNNAITFPPRLRSGTCILYQEVDCR
jgi:hypothetical protein